MTAFFWKVFTQSGWNVTLSLNSSHLWSTPWSPVLACLPPPYLRMSQDTSLPHFLLSFHYSFFHSENISWVRALSQSLRYPQRAVWSSLYTHWFSNMPFILMVPVSTSVWKVFKSAFSSVTSHLDTHSVIPFTNRYTFCIYSNIIYSKVNSFSEWKSISLPLFASINPVTTSQSSRLEILTWYFTLFSQFSIQSITVFWLFVFRMPSRSTLLHFCSHSLIQTFITSHKICYHRQ